MDTNDEKEHRQHGNGFFNGFIIGVAVGALLVFLLGTKKGKRLLEILTEEGLQSITEIENVLEENDGEVVETVEEVKEANHPSSNGHTNEHEAPVRKVTTTRRFFKGVPKRS